MTSRVWSEDPQRGWASVHMQPKGNPALFDPMATTALSPYLKFGCLSVRSCSSSRTLWTIAHCFRQFFATDVVNKRNHHHCHHHHHHHHQVAYSVISAILVKHLFWGQIHVCGCAIGAPGPPVPCKAAGDLCHAKVIHKSAGLPRRPVAVARVLLHCRLWHQKL